jgi:hypothetical protein
MPRLASSPLHTFYSPPTMGSLHWTPRPSSAAPPPRARAPTAAAPARFVVGLSPSPRFSMFATSATRDGQPDLLRGLTAGAEGVGGAAMTDGHRCYMRMMALVRRQAPVLHAAGRAIASLQGLTVCATRPRRRCCHRCPPVRHAAGRAAANSSFGATCTGGAAARVDSRVRRRSCDHWPPVLHAAGGAAVMVYRRCYKWWVWRCREDWPPLLHTAGGAIVSGAARPSNWRWVVARDGGEAKCSGSFRWGGKDLADFRKRR